MSNAEQSQTMAEQAEGPSIPFWVYGATTFLAAYLLVHMSVTGVV